MFPEVQCPPRIFTDISSHFSISAAVEKWNHSIGCYTNIATASISVEGRQNAHSCIVTCLHCNYQTIIKLSDQRWQCWNVVDSVYDWMVKHDIYPGPLSSTFLPHSIKLKPHLLKALTFNTNNYMKVNNVVINKGCIWRKVNFIKKS